MLCPFPESSTSLSSWRNGHCTRNQTVWAIIRHFHKFTALHRTSHFLSLGFSFLFSKMECLGQILKGLPYDDDWKLKPGFVKVLYYASPQQEGSPLPHFTS